MGLKMNVFELNKWFLGGFLSLSPASVLNEWTLIKGQVEVIVNIDILSLCKSVEESPASFWITGGAACVTELSDVFNCAS